MPKQDVQWNGAISRHEGQTYVSTGDLALLALKLKKAGYSQETVNVVSWIAVAGQR